MKKGSEDKKNRTNDNSCYSGSSVAIRVMSAMFAILFLHCRLAGCACAQDTVDRCWMDIPSAAVGGGLIVAGSLSTFIPALHGLCVDVRDAVYADGHNKLTFDNYLQYVPAVAVAVIGGVEKNIDIFAVAALSYASGALVLNAVKYFADVQRPDATAYNSFPSGHTFTAVVGAELLRRECGGSHPFVAAAGYAAAVVTAAMRVYNNRHWVADLLAGAGLAIVSVDFGYWAECKLKNWCVGKRQRSALFAILECIMIKLFIA